MIDSTSLACNMHVAGRAMTGRTIQSNLSLSTFPFSPFVLLLVWPASYLLPPARSHQRDRFFSLAHGCFLSLQSFSTDWHRRRWRPWCIGSSIIETCKQRRWGGGRSFMVIIPSSYTWVTAVSTAGGDRRMSITIPHHPKGTRWMCPCIVRHEWHCQHGIMTRFLHNRPRVPWQRKTVEWFLHLFPSPSPSLLFLVLTIVCSKKIAEVGINRMWRYIRQIWWGYCHHGRTSYFRQRRSPLLFLSLSPLQFLFMLLFLVCEEFFFRRQKQKTRKNAKIFSWLPPLSVKYIKYQTRLWQSVFDANSGERKMVLKEEVMHLYILKFCIPNETKSLQREKLAYGKLVKNGCI